MKKGWTIKTLGEVCQIKPPKNEARDRVSADALVSFLPMEGLGIDLKFVRATQTKPLSSVVGSYTYFQDGDVLLAKITPCFENGKLGIAESLVNGIGFGSSEYIVFRPDGTLSREWLYYYLSREVFRVEGAARMQGAVGHKRVAKEFIENYPIPLPSLPEQQRIVGILDEAFEGIATAKANAEKNLQNARALFESHLQSVFTQRGPGWVEKSLGDICAKITDGEHLRPNVTTSGVPFLSAKDVLDHDVVFDSSLFVSQDDATLFRRRCNPERNDILIVSRGATVGRTCVVKTDKIFCLLGSVILLKIAEGISSQFISYALKSPSIRSQLMTVSEAAAQQAIYLRDIKPLVIGCPPFTHQQIIVAKLDALREETQRLESIYQQKLDALEALKKSLLNQAFTGQLT